MSRFGLRSPYSRVLAGMALLALVVWGLLPGAPPVNSGEPSEQKASAVAEAGREELWQVIYVGRQRLGYAHSVTETVESDGRTIIRTTNDTHLAIKRFGDTSHVSTHLTTDETETGGLLGFELETRNPPAQSTHSKGRVSNGRLQLELTVGGQRQTRELPLAADIKSPGWQDRLLRKSPLKAGETRKFEAFQPEFAQSATVTMQAAEHEETELLDGSRRKLLPVTITHSLAPNLATRTYIDAEGEIVKTSTNMLGTQMLTFAVTREEALKEISGGELDIALGSLVKVKPIDKAHETRKITYRITVPGDDPAKYLSVEDTQTVRRIDDETVELTVTSLPLPRSAAHKEGSPEFLASTQFLQSDDPRVQTHARRAAGDAQQPAEVARRMEKYVHDTMTEKNFSTALASAAEVAETLSGDCSEHAVLLAAMLRAGKVPSRIAVGLVYVGRHSSFGGHMWTEAFLDGKWVPLDATLGRGGIGAAHIKLGDSSFGDDAPNPTAVFTPLLTLLGRMKLEVLRVE